MESGHGPGTLLCVDGRQCVPGDVAGPQRASRAPAVARVLLHLLSASLLTPVASRNLLLYQSLPFSIPNRHVILWRRKDDTGVGTTARGIVERLSCVPRRVPSDGGPSGRVRGALSTGA